MARFPLIPPLTTIHSPIYNEFKVEFAGNSQ